MSALTDRLHEKQRAREEQKRLRSACALRRRLWSSKRARSPALCACSRHESIFQRVACV